MAQRLKRLEPPYKSCSGCPLRRKRQFVEFESPDQTDAAIVGESPGRTEIMDRRPFIGESGRLVNSAFRELGVQRDQVFVGNVCQCRAVGLPDTKPTADVLRRCGHITANMMRLRGVEKVLALGGISMNFFMGTTGTSIVRNRGEWFRSKPFKMPGSDDTFTFDVLPTFHPAAILRRPDGFTEFIQDLEKFFFPERAPDYVPGTYFTVDDLETALIVLDCWHRSKAWLVIDLETSGYSPHNDYIICVAATGDPGEAYVFTNEVIRQRGFWRKIHEMNRDGMKWVMHGAFFDHRFVYKKTGIDLNVGMDTMLANYSLDERGGVHDLKNIAASKFGFPDWESNIRQYLRRVELDSYAKIPRDVLHKYAGFDADAEARLYEYQLKRLGPQQYKLLDTILLPGTVALGKISLSGIAVDMQHWHRLQNKYTEMADNARAYMQEYVGDPDFNPNSFRQVQHWMYDVFDLPTHDKSAREGHHPKLSSGRTSTLPPRTTAMDQLERLSTGYEQSIWIRSLIVYRTKRKALTSYLKGYKPNESTGRIHPRYLAHGTRTGRLSSRDPNIMNAPHYGFIRELIVPAEGCVLVSVDYSQAELRVLGALAGSEMMADIYRRGGDLHDIVSTEIFGKGYTKRERMIAKAIVFGIVYGRSISNIAETFGIPIEKAHEYYNTFLGRFDGVLDWMTRQKEFALEHGYIDQPTGHRRRFPLITRANVAEVQRQAVNTPVQGTASYLMFISLIRLHEYVSKEGGNALFPLHDSIMFELPLDKWKEMTLHIVDVMEKVPEEVFGPQLPFAADCDVGWRWGRMMEFKKKGGILVLDDDPPGWWPVGQPYPEPVTFDQFILEPEPEDWHETLVWEETEWENSSTI